MKNKKRNAIIVVILIIIIIIVGFFLYRFINKNSSVEPKVVEVLDEIKNYDYYLEDRDTEIYKENFMKLKDLLKKSETIDYQEYAKYIAILFLIDLYTIDNKVSKYDVGALEFIYPSEKEKFQNKVMDTMYKLVLDNSTNTRSQELPIVSNVELESLEKTEYSKGDINLEGFLIKANIKYQKDLGYDKSASITIVKEDDKLYVVNLTNFKN